jgi:PAS domain S-box-containing protein
MFLRGPLVRIKKAYGKAALPATYPAISVLIAIVTISVGSCALAGWFFKLSALTSLGQGWASMKPNSAIAFIAAGLALWLLACNQQLSAIRSTLAIAIALLTTLIGVISLGEYLLHFSLSVDDLVLRKTLRATGVLHAGRPAFSTALGLSSVGFGLLTLDLRLRRKFRYCEWFAVVAILIGFVTLLGYIFGVKRLYEAYGFTSIAIHTASLLLLLGIGILCARPQQGLMAIITTDDIGGYFGRRILPLIVLFPMFNAWIRLYGQRHGWYGAEVGLALNAGTQVCGLVAVLWLSAFSLNRMDRVRRVADQQLLLNEERMRVALKNSPIVVFNQDRHLRYTWINNPRLAWAHKGHLGKTDADVLGDTKARDLTAIKQQVLATGARIRHEVAIESEGQTRWFDLTLEPLRNDKGEVVGITGASVDISAKIRTELALREREEQFRTLANAIPQLCWMANADGWIHWYNERWYQYTGTAIDQMRGWGWQSVHDPVELPKVMERWQASIATGEPFDMVFPLRGADGVFRPFLTRVMPVKDAEGRLVQWFGTNTDISEQKRTEDALRQREARLREYARVVEGLEEMIAVVDRDYRYVIANHAFLKYRGLEKQELVGRHIAEVLNKEAFEEIIKAKLDESFQGKIVRFEMKYSYPDLGERDLFVSYFPIEVEGRIDSVASVLRDVTERKRAEAELREREDRYRDLVESSHDLICTHDLNGKLLSVNSAAASALEYPVPALLETPMREIIAPAFREQFDQYLVRIGKRGADKGFMAVLTRTGQQRIWQYDNTLRTDGVSSPIVRGIAQDVTERVSAERRLRESEAQLRLLVHAANIGLWDWDLIGNQIYFSPEWKTQIGYAQHEIPNRVEEWQSRVHPDDLAPIQEKIKAYLTDPKGQFEGEFRFRHKTGAYRWILTKGDVLCDATGTPVRMLGCHLDITERKLEEESVRTQGEQLRALSSRLQEIREEERTIVARDLHDQIGQILTAVKMDVAWLTKHLPPDKPAQDRLQMTGVVLNDALHSVRRICSGLRPGVLDDLGLAAAIEWQANEFGSRTGISCDVSIAPADLEVSSQQATAIFRIFQEALTNVARHAGASSVRAQLRQQNGDVEMVLEDDGRGIRESELAGSLGILGMKERAQMCGGVVQVFGSPGRGTTVMVRMPREKHAGEQHAHTYCG